MNNTFTSIITPNVALGAFIIILLVALFIANLCNPKHYNTTRAKIFISCLAGLGIFVTFLFYYSIVSLQQSQQRYDIIRMTSHISKMLSHEVVNLLQTASQKIPHFVSSLHPLLQQQVDQEDDDTIENNMLKYTISYKIFTLWQELLIATPFLDLDQQSYLCLFLQKANSPQLYDQWQKIKLDFNQETQEFGDLLFSYALPNKKQTVKRYHCLAKQILCHKKYLQLMKN